MSLPLIVPFAAFGEEVLHKLIMWSWTIVINGEKWAFVHRDPSETVVFKWQWRCNGGTNWEFLGRSYINYVRVYQLRIHHLVLARWKLI